MDLNLISSRSKLLFTIFLSLLLHVHITNGHGGHDHDSPENAELHSKGLILVKVWCLIIMFVTTFAGGMSPYFYRWNESFLLLGTQFAGGVFLGTAMMHFLSDSTEGFGDLTTKSYPFSFMLACSGYLLTMLADCIISYVAKGSNEKETQVLHVEENIDTNPMFVRTTSFGDTILLILALCFHSVFEGIAVGVAGK